METQVPADGGAAPPPMPVEQRLAAVEHRLDALEGSIRDELHAAGEELRRAVSELGRLLLRDLDRLTKVLAEHRDAIVERLMAASHAPPEPGPDHATTAEPEAAHEPGPRPDTSEPETHALRGEEGRWWAFPGRRRPRRS
jgi:hypothetical protein